MSNSGSNENATIFVLSLALLVTIILAGAGAYAGYVVGYSQADADAQVKIAQAEKKAAALPAQLTVPMILFFLPVLFLVVLGPAYIGFKSSQAGDQASTPAIEQTDTNWG